MREGGGRERKEVERRRRDGERSFRICVARF